MNTDYGSAFAAYKEGDKLIVGEVLDGEGYSFDPKNPNPGVYDSLPNSYYHNSFGISKSGLDLIARSPAHYIASKSEPRVETPAMRTGTMLHLAILEPDVFGNTYAVQPKFDRRTKQGKADAEEWATTFAGFQPITDTEYDSVMRAAEAVRNHPACAFLFKKGVAEQSVFANDPETGVLVKARPDWQAQCGDLRINCDLKSTEDARFVNFQRSAFNYGYAQQPAFYSDVCEWAGLPKPDSWFFLVLEKAAPYGVMLYEPDAEFIDYGRRKYREALNTYAECLKSGKWPSYQAEVQSLSLPAWAA